MSGSDDGGWTPPNNISPCEQLSFTANINSPQPSTLSSLEVGMVLDLTLQMSPYASVLVGHNGNLVGTLTGINVSRLINCIQTGFNFVATVLAVSGGNCTVKVSPL